MQAHGLTVIFPTLFYYYYYFIIFNYRFMPTSNVQQCSWCRLLKTAGLYYIKTGFTKKQKKQKPDLCTDVVL